MLKTNYYDLACMQMVALAEAPTRKISKKAYHLSFVLTCFDRKQLIGYTKDDLGWSCFEPLAAHLFSCNFDEGRVGLIFQ